MIKYWSITDRNVILGETRHMNAIFYSNHLKIAYSQEFAITKRCKNNI